jgi:hypothetical protein
MWKFVFALSAVATIYLAAGAPVTECAGHSNKDVVEVSAERIMGHIKYLSSDELEGRGTGEAGEEKAARYIAEHFAEAGLTPAGDGNTFLQRFGVVVEASLGEGNELAILFEDIRQAYRLDEDFLPLSFSENAAVTGDVVFAGYGITAKEFEYDDYEGIDAKDKIVLVMRHEPAEKDEESPFEGSSLTHYSDLRYKAMNAREHGAAALVLCTDPLNHPDSVGSLLEFDARQGRSSSGIPCVQLSTPEAAEMMRSAGYDLSELQARIDRELMPQSRPLQGVRLTLTTEISRDSRSAFNVLGLLRGTDSVLSEEIVVLGAHFDHLGKEGEDIYHGADDNASGTAALLELARIMTSMKRPPARSILFAAFSGEELGLLGSMHLAGTLQGDPKRGSGGSPGTGETADTGDTRDAEDAPELSEVAGTAEVTDGGGPPDKGERAPHSASRPSAAMINMDMIGRLSEKKVYVGGVESSPLFKPLLDELGVEYGLELEYSEPAYGASDHTAFYAKDVPVLMFFTGAHTDHHKPTDTWDKIDVDGEVLVVSLVFDALLSIASHSESIAFTRSTGDVVSPHRGEGYGGRGRASLGIVPDFSGGGDGLILAGIREGSAADEAGLESGDVMVSFDGRTVKDLRDLSYLLKEKRPGDSVVIVVLRDGEEVTTKAVLRDRSAGR